ncbi:MAG: DUF2793 domain-containing protein [Notoacmeibacter sp.]|nr:DUF2793 domain-containing protein [Notoacmeibacter sp.]
MLDTSPRFSLAYIFASQAQKHVTHNEAVHLLDALVHACIENEADTPPASPPQGHAGWSPAMPAANLPARTAALPPFRTASGNS